MNIFYLDEDVEQCAQYHCDKHVIKMILESAQLLCTAINVAAGEQITPYKTTHINHPCALWTRASLQNWLYVYRLMLALDKERQYRYMHSNTHKSVITLSGSNIKLLDGMYMPATGFTSPALCMPNDCIDLGNATECYRQYYRTHKTALHSWTRRGVPGWL